MVFGALQSSGSRCCILPLYLFDKLLSHLLLLKIRKTKAKSDPAIDEFGEVHGSKECSLSKGVVIHRYSQSLCGFFFCLLKRHWAKGISVCWNGTWFDQLPEQFPQLYGNRASLFFKNLKTPVGRWTLWELTSSLTVDKSAGLGYPELVREFLRPRVKLGRLRKIINAVYSSGGHGI